MIDEHSSVNTPTDHSQLDDDQSGEGSTAEELANQLGRQATRQNIKVICRIRPTNDKEIQNNGVDILTHDHESIEIKNEDYDLQFTFDRVFGKETSQIDMFDKCAKPLIADIFAGYNATIFAYGQTGTGKTFTMEGEIEDEVNKGIIPRSIEALFEFIADSDDTIEFTIKVSYIEIYMERIRDLLDHTRTKLNLAIREHKTAGIYIADVTEEYVTSVKGILRLMQIGARNRSVAATGMNEGSSRSHSVFTVTVSQKNVHTAEVKTGKLVLVDLAGSEMVKKTNSSGQQLEEAKTINKSLSALGLVINALTDEKSTHIPYRDSKLTRLLQDSLGGNSKTVLIIAISPSSYNAMETVSTLRFGMRAKSIENKVEVNRTRTVEMLEALLEKAELAIDKQNTMIATLKARLDVALASQQQQQQEQEEQGKIMEQTAMIQLQEVIDKLNNELSEEREYSNKLYKKLEEVKTISDGRRTLIEDATAMLEAIQKTNLMLSEQVESLKQEKAILTAELETVKVSISDEIAKLKFDNKEKENHMEALSNEIIVLKDDNMNLKEKINQLQQANANSTPRIRSMNFGSTSMFDVNNSSCHSYSHSQRCDTPSSVISNGTSHSHGVNTVASAKGSLLGTGPGIAGMTLFFPEESEPTVVHLEPIKEADQSIKEEKELSLKEGGNMEVAQNNMEENAANNASSSTVVDAVSSSVTQGEPVVEPSTITAASVTTEGPTGENTQEVSTYTIPDLPQHDRALDKLCEDILSTKSDIVEMISPAVAAMVLEQFAMGELMSTSHQNLRIALAGEELRTALRDRFDNLQTTQSELQTKCDVLDIEKQELNKKIEQRDERIKELEASTSDLRAQMFEKTKTHTQEMEALKSLIQAMKLEHQQEIEEIRKTKASTPLIKADEIDPSPRTIRGGTLSPSSVLNRSFMYKEEEEKRLSQRKKSLETMDANRQDNLKTESPLLLGASTPISAVEKSTTNTHGIATEDAIQPQTLVMPPTPPPRVNSGRPPLPSPAAATAAQPTTAVTEVPQSVKPVESTPAVPASNTGGSSSGPAAQGNACCVIS